MKETVVLEAINEEKIVLPISYNHIVQGMIYENLDKELSNFLHNEGFQKDKRIYKMFTFSRLIGPYFLDRENGKIIFSSPIKLIISSPYAEFNNSIGSKLLTSEVINLGNNYVRVTEIKVTQEQVEGEEIEIATLSPVVVYSTLYKVSGEKFTYYYNPYEKEFSEIISNNLKNKYKAFYLKNPPEGDVKIRPITKTRLSVIKYKDFVIKGYSGRFIMTGPKELLELGLSTGLGNKNSQGFGCVQLIND